MNRKQIAEEFSKSMDYSEIEKIILFGSVSVDFYLKQGETSNYQYQTT